MSNKKKTALFAAAILLILVSVFIWRQGRQHGLDKADLQLIEAKPLASKARRMIGEARPIRPDEPDAVSEKVAQSLIRQLENWGGKGKELAAALRECSALHVMRVHKDYSTCTDEYSGDVDVQCLIKRRIGQKEVEQMLTADRYDLNADGIDDYVISDRYYCGQLSANQSNVYFVMLSRTKDDFRLAYADWAAERLNVVEEPASKQKVVIEQAYHLYGDFSTVMKLVDGKYVPRVCIVKKDEGYSSCRQP